LRADLGHLAAYHEAGLTRALAARLAALTGERKISVMEVCGTHTVAIARAGLKSMLPGSIRLISGPGCPVCVTPQGEIERAAAAAAVPDVILASFGDMLRVPGRAGSLETARSRGADVRVVFSPRDALRLARQSPERQVVVVGVGFETTIPAFAATLRQARAESLGNFTVLNSFRLVPPVLAAVLESSPALDGFLLPGHVSAVLGTAPYAMLPAAGKAAAVAGFEPVDVLLALRMIAEQLRSGRFSVEVAYRRAVRPEGNPAARALIDEVFEPACASWRGLGRLPGSGLEFRPAYRAFDAARRFGLEASEAPEPPGCGCARVLLGLLAPRECPLFGRGCTPDSPVGPCMVSSEGSCAAEYRYGTEAAR
jgi:hydrogenase expression/formation protein HypD